MESTGHVAVYWGRSDDADAVVVDIAHGSIAVSGHRIDDWFESLPTTGLSPLQADQAWQTVVTGIGRPDPLSLSRLTVSRSAPRLVAGSTGHAERGADPSSGRGRGGLADDGLDRGQIIGLPTHATDDRHRDTGRVALHQFGGAGQLVGDTQLLDPELVTVGST